MMFKDQCEAERSAGRMWSNVLTFILKQSCSDFAFVSQCTNGSNNPGNLTSSS